MLTIRIKNDGTGTLETANYDYAVYVNDAVIATGHVDGHERILGWQYLLKQVAEDGALKFINKYENLLKILEVLREESEALQHEKLQKAAESMREEYLTNPDLNMDFCHGCDVKNNPKCDKCVGS
jgi:hypothetical protein